MKRVIILIVIIMVMLTSCATEIITRCSECGTIGHYFNYKMGDEVTCPSCQEKFILFNRWRK